MIIDWRIDGRGIYISFIVLCIYVCKRIETLKRKIKVLEMKIYVTGIYIC